MKWKPSKVVHGKKHWIGNILLRIGSPHKRQTIKYKYIVCREWQAVWAVVYLPICFLLRLAWDLQRLSDCQLLCAKWLQSAENPSLILCLNAHSFVLKKTIAFLLSSEALAEYLIGFLSRKFYTLRIMNYELPMIFRDLKKVMEPKSPVLQ